MKHSKSVIPPLQLNKISQSNEANRELASSRHSKLGSIDDLCEDQLSKYLDMKEEFFKDLKAKIKQKELQESPIVEEKQEQIPYKSRVDLKMRLMEKYENITNPESEFRENEIINDMVEGEYDYLTKVHKMNKIEDSVRRMKVLKSIKKEKEDRDKFIIQKNEMRLLNEILAGKGESTDFLEDKVSPNNKYFVYSQMIIDYKKKLQILNTKMQKQQVQVYLECNKDPKLLKLKAKMKIPRKDPLARTTV